jgi:tetratricopeptide (TPR) repeat protein
VNGIAKLVSTARTAPRPGLRRRPLAAAPGLLLLGLLVCDATSALEPAFETLPDAEGQAAAGTLSQAAAEGDVIALPEGGDDASKVATPVYVPRRTPAQDYLDAIDRLEGEYGPYATELSDLYLGLGQTYLDSGEYELARDAFHRGVMAVRVNSGPNSPEQTNHLYLIANIETMLGESAAADQVLHNIYFINSEYYGEDSLEMLPVLERIYAWYQMIWPTGSDEPDFDDYERMLTLTEKIVDVTEANYGETHAATARAYRRLGDAEFQIVRHLTSEDWMVAITSGTLESRGGGSISVTDHYDSARRAYKKSIDALQGDPATTPLELAEALVNQADWYLVFGRSRRARNLYEEAWQVLAKDEEYAELVNSFLGQPRPMHFVEPPPAYLEELPPELEEMSVDVSMTVTSFGDVRYVEVKNPPEVLSKQQLGVIEQEVRETPFRPAMKEGQVVTTKDFIWQFAVAPQVATS